MAKTSDVAAEAAVPSSADIERAAAFAREPFLLDGEGPEALAPGTARRRALDAALKELDEGAEYPSIQWRRDFSLLLGLERFLADEPPKLLDGAELNPHQVDALSGTLAELMWQQQARRRRGRGERQRRVERRAPPWSSTAAEVEADDADPTRRRTRSWLPTRSRRTGRKDPPRRTRRSSRRPPRTPAPSAASGSSTRPAPARPSPPSASSRRPAPAGC